MLTDTRSIEAALELGWSNLRNPLLVAVLLPLLGLAINVLAQVALLRLSRGRGFMRTLALGFFAGGLLTVVGYPIAASHWCAAGPGDIRFTTLLLEWLILIAPAYAGLGYGYANFANLGNSSIRIRLYEELRRFPEGCLRADIRRTFDEAGILKLRLQRLSESGDLVQAGGHWRTGKRRFVHIGRVIFFAKQLVLGRRSEFDPPPAP